MKKITVFIMTLITAVALFACGGGVSANITEGTTTAETITVKVKVNDENNEIVANSLVAKAYLDDSMKVEQKTHTTVDEEQNIIQFKLTPLDRDTTYVVRIYATIGEEQRELTSGTYTTRKEGATVEEAITVSTKEEFLEMSDSPNSYFELKNDIDFGGDTIKAEEFFSASSSSQAFKGHLDGKGFTVKNLNLKTSSKPTYIGLFGYVYGSADREEPNIKDLTLDNIHILATTYNSTFHAGVLAGRVSNNSVIENVTVKNSSVNFELKGNAASPSSIGGAIGHLEGKASNIVTENTNVFATLGGTNSVNIGGAIGYVYHSSTPKTVNNISSSGLVEFVGLITSSQKRPVTVNVGGVIGHYNAYKPATNLVSDVDINVTEFQFTNIEGEKNEVNKNNNDTLRVGGIMGELTSNHLISKGYYAGSINVNNFDEYMRIEGIIVSGLFAWTTPESNIKDFARVGDNSSITINTYGTENYLVSDYESFEYGITNKNTGRKVYGDSNVVVRDTPLPKSPFEPTANMLAAVDSEYVSTRFDKTGASLYNVSVTGSEVSFGVNISDAKNSYNHAALTAKLFNGNTEVKSAVLSNKNNEVLFDGLNANTDYVIKVFNGTTEIATRSIKTLNAKVTISDIDNYVHRIAFKLNVENASGIVDENTLVTTLYEHNAVQKKSSASEKDIVFTGLSGSKEYKLVVTATVNNVENVVVHQSLISTDSLSVLEVSASTATPTSITAKLAIPNLTTKGVVADSMKIKVYQNGGSAIETKDFTNNPTDPAEFTCDSLKMGTIYKVVITANIKLADNSISEQVIAVLYGAKTTKITGNINNVSVTLQPELGPKVVKLAFDASLNNNDNNDAINLKVSIWKNGTKETEVDFAGNLVFENLKQDDIIVIKITGTVGGESVTLHQQTITLTVN